MNLTKFLNKIGLSWNDLLIVVALLETCWWLMYSFVDGADALLRIEDEIKVEYHPFLVVQKAVSSIKLILTVGCIWYGAIFMGKDLPLRLYLISGILVDLTLILTWMALSFEESWPLSPTNIFGLHYILTFISIRIFIYWLLYSAIGEIFSSPFGSAAVGTVNGNIVGIPEPSERRSVGSGNNLVFFGRGFKAVLEYYRVEAEKAYLITVCWDIVWNVSILISQELPEAIFNIIFIGIFGSLALNIPTENLTFRLLRLILGLIGVYITTKKVVTYMKAWIIVYIIAIVANVGFFCYVASTILTDETALAIIILCMVFFASNGGKLFVLFCAGRYYMHLKLGNTVLINENNNDNGEC